LPDAGSIDKFQDLLNVCVALPIGCEKKIIPYRAGKKQATNQHEVQQISAKPRRFESIRIVCLNHLVPIQ
jgi:hypothetical protein